MPEPRGTVEQIPEEVRSLAARAASALRAVVGRDARVFWFGSWVDERAVERSDIDLGVDAGRRFTPEERIRIDRQLEALPTLRGVDVVDLRAVAPSFRERVLGTGIAL